MHAVMNGAIDMNGILLKYPCYLHRKVAINETGPFYEFIHKLNMLSYFHLRCIVRVFVMLH